MNKLNLQPDDAILLIIDFQEKLMTAMQGLDKVYKNTQLLIEVARQLQIPVIVTEQYPKGLGHTVPEISSVLPEAKKYLTLMPLSDL